jgi:hypothetical protein
VRGLTEAQNQLVAAYQVARDERDEAREALADASLHGRWLIAEARWHEGVQRELRRTAMAERDTARRERDTAEIRAKHPF